jgi:hypothetical protein
MNRFLKILASALKPVALLKVHFNSDLGNFLKYS